MSIDADGKRGVGENVVLSVAEATGLGEHALQRLGFSAEEARIIAANLVDAELSGNSFGCASVVASQHHNPDTSGM